LVFFFDTFQIGLFKLLAKICQASVFFFAKMLEIFVNQRNDFVLGVFSWANVLDILAPIGFDFGANALLSLLLELLNIRFVVSKNVHLIIF